ncbi:MAG: SpoIIE family protein phosphatase [Spirochaetales bacterium]|nr:SpoIIE family protein phosphatase [Spirochaetales bacterium]
MNKLHIPFWISGITIFFALSLVNVTGLKARPFNVAEDLAGAPIGRHLSILEDTARSLTINDVQAHPDFTLSRSDAPGFGYSGSAYWARFSLSNPAPNGVRRFLEIGYPHTDRISFFVPTETPFKDHSARANFTEIQTGDSLPFHNRPINYRNFVLPLDLAPGQTATYYLRFETESSVNFQLRIWSPELFFNFVTNEQIILGLYSGAMVVMLLYNLFIFMSIRDISYLYYILFIGSFGLFQISLNGTAYQYLWPESIWWENHSYPFLVALAMVGCGMFGRLFLGTRELIPVVDRFLLLLVVAVCLSAPVAIFSYRLSLRLIIILATLLVMTLLVVAILALRRGSRPALFYITAWSAFLASACLLALQVGGVIQANFFTEWATQIGSAALVVLLSLGLADVINTMKSRLQVYSTKLEHLVDQRTSELQKTLSKVEELKKAQDGDYFLTSLILKPLGGDYSRSSSIRVQMLVRQKKQFIFKERRSQIGGDLCAAYSIQLRGRTYTVFINGDAMGKSQQGAGGALVLGTVFKAVVSRTQASSLAQDKHPEKWLKDCFIELQNVFVAFDGTMLVSAFFGLVDDATGLMYYINADHPWTVLYRQGTATFLEENTPIRKIGIEGLSSSLSVRLFAMAAGDVVIMGSDGRDDILLGSGADGGRIINEDERAFLRRVEDGLGSLAGIEQAIRSHGELTDDLSLLRVEYQPNRTMPDPDQDTVQRLNRARQALLTGDFLLAVRELERVDSAPPGALKLLAQACLKSNRLEQARQACERYLEHAPQDTEFLQVAVSIYRRSRLYRHAADTGERLRLRQPLDVRNLIRLADTYRLLGNNGRAIALLHEAMKIDPDHHFIKSLQQALETQEPVAGAKAATNVS